MKIVALLFLFQLILSTLGHVAKYALWYDKPVSEWAQALPLRDARIGALVYV
jgi:hypothetical protein